MTNGAEHAAGMPAGTGSPTVPVTESGGVGAASGSEPSAGCGSGC